MGMITRLWDKITGRNKVEVEMTKSTCQSIEENDEVSTFVPTEETDAQVETVTSEKPMEGVVEDSTVVETKITRTGKANQNFSKIICSKYADKRKRLEVKDASISFRIAMAEESKSKTDDKYLAGLAEKDIQNNKKEQAKIEEMLTVSEEDFTEVMRHKSNIAYLNLIQKILAKYKKAEREALANCSRSAREMAKGCRPVLPFDTEETVKTIEDKVTLDESKEIKF